LQQYAGRLHRLHDNKRVVQVYDYIDNGVPMLARMYERRLKGYSAIGYSIEQAMHLLLSCNIPDHGPPVSLKRILFMPQPVVTDQMGNQLAVRL
jgi:hypothetical protein